MLGSKTRNSSPTPRLTGSLRAPRQDKYDISLLNLSNVTASSRTWKRTVLSFGREMPCVSCLISRSWARSDSRAARLTETVAWRGVFLAAALLYCRYHARLSVELLQAYQRLAFAKHMLSQVPPPDGARASARVARVLILMLPARCTPLGSTRRTLVLYRDNRRFLGISILGSNHTSSNSKTYKMRVRVRIPMGFCHIFGPKIDIPTSSTTREHADRHGRRVTSFIDASSQASSLLPPRDDGLQDGAFDAVGDRHDTYYYYRIAMPWPRGRAVCTRAYLCSAQNTQRARPRIDDLKTQNVPKTLISVAIDDLGIHGLGFKRVANLIAKQRNAHAHSHPLYSAMG